MSHEPSIADLKSAFAAHLATLPPPTPGRHDHYQLRTRGRTLVTAGAAFAAVVAVASAAVTFTSRDPGAGSIAVGPPTMSTVDIMGTGIALPDGVSRVEPGCLVQARVPPDDSEATPDPAGWSVVIMWWPQAGHPNECFRVQTNADGTVSPPSDAEPTTVGGVDAWTWRVDDLVGIAEAHAYFVELPARDDLPGTSLVMVVAGATGADVPGTVENILDRLLNASA